jgi:hypothetical protein
MNCGCVFVVVILGDDMRDGVSLNRQIESSNLIQVCKSGDMDHSQYLAASGENLSVVIQLIAMSNCSGLGQYVLQ